MAPIDSRLCPDCRPGGGACSPRSAAAQPIRRCSAPTVDRRHPVLLATLAETYVEVLDELVQLLDQALAGADSRARHELSHQLVDRATAEADRGRLLDEILDVLADPNVPDEQAGRLVRAAGRHGAPASPPAGPLTERESARSWTLRLARRPLQVSAHLHPCGDRRATADRQHHQPDRHGAAHRSRGAARAQRRRAHRRSRTQATTAKATAFVPARWRWLPRCHPRSRPRRRVPALLGTRASSTGCRPGCAPATCGCPAHAATPTRSTLLIPPERWAGQRDDFCTITGTDAEPVPAARSDSRPSYTRQWPSWNECLADPAREGLARLGDDGELIVSPLPAEQVPAEAERSPRPPRPGCRRCSLPALLIEVDRAHRVQRGVHPRRRCPATQPRTDAATCTRR